MFETLIYMCLLGVYVLIGFQMVEWAEQREPEIKEFPGWPQGRVVIVLSWPIVVVVSLVSLIIKMSKGL